MSISFNEKYKKEILPELMKEFGYNNIMQIPKLVKISVNSGLGNNFKEAKLLETIENVLTRITGQKPIPRRAKKSISNFKIREGNIIGMSVTIRGKRMTNFFEKLVNITLPRVRDFQGISENNVDKQGNLSIGLKEYLAFPEIRSDEVEIMHGVQISIATTAKNHNAGIALFRKLGIPFKKNN